MGHKVLTNIYFHLPTSTFLRLSTVESTANMRKMSKFKLFRQLISVGIRSYRLERNENRPEFLTWKVAVDGTDINLTVIPIFHARFVFFFISFEQGGDS